MNTRLTIRNGKEIDTRPLVESTDSSDVDDSCSNSELELDDVLGGEESTPLATDLFAINPMLNSVVLKNLFELCELEDLRRFRLVSKLWYEISLARWRNEMTIEIVSPEGVTNTEGDHLESSLLNWNDIHLLYNYDKIGDKPFRKFKLRNWTYPKTVKEGKRNWNQFWRICGPWMHSLHLSNPTFQTKEQLVSVIVEMTPNLKTLKLTRMRSFVLENVPVQSQRNLKSLTVSLLEDESTWYSPELIPWRQLFRFFPNLQEVECLELRESNYANLMDAIDELSLSGSHGRGRKLNLKVNGIEALRFNGSELVYRMLTALDQLMELPQLRITEMEIALRTRILAPTFFQKLFELHGSTLKKLVLFNPICCDCKEIIAPPLLYLRNLAELQLCFGTVQDLHFFEHVPNLRKLILNKVPFRSMMNSTDTPKMDNVSIANLHEFRMTMSSDGRRIVGKLTQTDASLLAKWMPNLRSFTGELTKEAFRVVCDKWRELRELDILTSDKLGDEVITGIERGVDTPFPNVTNLKLLRKFKGSRLLLSEDSIWNGFLQLDYIYWLEIRLSSRVTDKAFIALFKKCPTPFLVRRDPKAKEKRKLNRKVAVRAAKLANEFGIGYDLQEDSEYPWAG